MTTPTTPALALVCAHCGAPLETPTATRGNQHLCGACFDTWDAHMREVEEHEARIADVPHIAMLRG